MSENTAQSSDPCVTDIASGYSAPSTLERRRVMFVDDDERLLDGLERMLFEYADDWELSFVSSATEALEKIAVDGMDVVITDMRMPGMGGAELLSRLQSEFPAVARIVLSGQAEAEAVTRALMVAHTFLTKPCKAAALVATVQHALDVHAMVTDTVMRDVAGRVGAVPSRPAIYTRLTELLPDPRTTLAMLASVIAEDVAIAARVVMLANSAMFSRGGACYKIEQAVSRIGIDLLRALVLGIEMTESMRSVAREVDLVHAHSLEVGLLARALAGAEFADEALLAGVVHDIGQLVLLQCTPKPMRKLLALEDPEAVAASEARLGGVTHARLGAYVLGMWGMSYDIVDAVASHHEPLGTLPDTLDIGQALRVSSALLEGRTCEDPRWPQWQQLAQSLRSKTS